MLQCQGVVYGLCWSSNFLATIDFSHQVRLWTRTGDSAHVLSLHQGKPYSLAFSPDGAFLATGAFDHVVAVWNATTGQLQGQYKSSGCVFDIGWNCTGNLLAACTSNQVLCFY